MTVTVTNKGRYRILKTDLTTTDNKITDLSDALDTNNIDGKKVVLFDVSNSTVVAEIGR